LVIFSVFCDFSFGGTPHETLQTLQKFILLRVRGTMIKEIKCPYL